MIQLCRLCLREGKRMLSIFDKGIASEKLRSRILDCCPIELFQDELLPSSICSECEYKVRIAYEFREECRKSERTLQSRYEAIYRRRPLNITFRDIYVQTEPYRLKVSREDSSCRLEENPPPIFAEDERKEEKEEEGDKEENGDRVRTDLLESNLEFVAKDSFDIFSEDRRDWIDSEEKEACIVRLKKTVDPRKIKRLKKDEPRYLCDVCSKTFASKSGLRFHLKAHNGAKPHVCRYCDKGFAIPSYKKRHERIHAGDKRYVCHVCSARFASSNGFKYHLRSHTGEANYRCKTCGKSFRRDKYLKEHVFTHTGERPFACKICGIAYGNSGSLFTHEKKCKLRYDRKS